MEALDYFEEICNNIYFLDTAILLLLNKQDLFEEKIKFKSIKDIPAFSDYSDIDNGYDEGIQYFLEKFLAKNHQNSDRKIYHHVTTSTDQGNMKVIFNTCHHVVMGYLPKEETRKEEK